MNEYDLVIVGAGPAGLALAQCCSFLKDVKILVIEKDEKIGGCHRVNRVNGLFSEHGPRIYSSTYKNFDTLLREMGTSFSDLFVPYNFQMLSTGTQIMLSTMTFRELSILSYHIIVLMFDDNHGRDISMITFMRNNGYSTETKSLVDRLCRLADGGNMYNFTLNKFLQIINQQMMYTIAQPRNPTDVELFPKWETFLKNRNVDFLLNSEVSKFHTTGNKIVGCDVKNSDNKVRYIEGKKFVLAVPPTSIVKIISKTKIPDAFSDFSKLEKWSKKTDYIEYISITFHWDSKLDLAKVYGFPKSDWGVSFIVLSDYMKFQEKESKTVISTAVTIVDSKSAHINKTANQCTDKKELIQEIFRQLNESFKELPEPTISVLNSKNYYDKNKQTWASKDAAFIESHGSHYIPFESDKYSNLYNLGTHNGKSIYNFTSLESAVSNAFYLSGELYPSLKEKYEIKSVMNLRDMLIYLVIFLLVLLIILYKR